MIREEVVAGHLHALRAWARICDTLPEAAATPKNQHEALLMVAWRCVDELLLDLFREIDTGRSDAIWRDLRSDALAVPATAVFAEVARAGMMDHRADSPRCTGPVDPCVPRSASSVVGMGACSP
jgi:hypothetical protein